MLSNCGSLLKKYSFVLGPHSCNSRRDMAHISHILLARCLIYTHKNYKQLLESWLVSTETVIRKR